jgi:hypothetical protein
MKTKSPLSRPFPFTRGKVIISFPFKRGRIQEGVNKDLSQIVFVKGFPGNPRKEP